MKKPEATDIVAFHAVSTLPDSLEARRKILGALLAACPRSRYAERISVMLEYLEQHQACLESSTRLRQACGRPEFTLSNPEIFRGKSSKSHSMSKSQTQNPNQYE
jgi:hypothetical protein